MAVDGMVAHLGGLHPLQALASADGDPDKLQGIVFAVEGDEESLAASRELAEGCGGKPVEILPDKKLLYHAAAVVSANFLTVLVDMAVLLAILVFNDADVQNRVITTERVYSPSELTQAANFLNSAFAGKDLLIYKHAIAHIADVAGAPPRAFGRPGAGGEA